MMSNLINFYDSSFKLSVWLNEVAMKTVSEQRDMGANLSSTGDFHEVHRLLNENIKVGELMNINRTCRLFIA